MTAPAHDFDGTWVGALGQKFSVEVDVEHAVVRCESEDGHVSHLSIGAARSQITEGNWKRPGSVW